MNKITAPRRLALPTPALDAWRRELRAGERTRETFDPLWRAACAEMYGREEPWRAETHLAVSRRIIREAAKPRRGAA